jgi:hypothetical protein
MVTILSAKACKDDSDDKNSLHVANPSSHSVIKVPVKQTSHICHNCIAV